MPSHTVVFRIPMLKVHFMTVHGLQEAVILDATIATLKKCSVIVLVGQSVDPAVGVMEPQWLWKMHAPACISRLRHWLVTHSLNQDLSYRQQKTTAVPLIQAVIPVTHSASTVLPILTFAMPLGAIKKVSVRVTVISVVQMARTTLRTHYQRLAGGLKVVANGAVS